MRSTKTISLFLVLLGLALLIVACAAPATTPAPEPATAATPVPPTATAEPEPTDTPEPEPEPTNTPEPEPEPTEMPVEESESEEPETAMAAGDPLAGEYIFRAAVGCGCHFNRDTTSLAGGNKFEGPFGVVYSANITSDVATGIGGWTDEEIANAIRFGARPESARDAQGIEDGTTLAFIMPKYATMSDTDVMDLVAYLRTLDPVSNEVPLREFNVPLQPFTPETAPPAEAPTDPIERGHYLAEIVRCSNCHTPNNEQGGKDMSMYLAGSPYFDTVAPNLTPDEVTGIGMWSEEELVEFLSTGVFFDGSEVEGPMRRVIDQSLSNLTQEDVEAIVAFLKSLPPIQNEPATP